MKGAEQNKLRTKGAEQNKQNTEPKEISKHPETDQVLQPYQWNIGACKNTKLINVKRGKKEQNTTNISAQIGI